MGWVRGRRAPFAALLTLGIAGCSALGGAPPPPCPVASIVSDAARATIFKPGPGRDLIDIEFEVEIDAVASDCDYNRAGDEITTRTGVRIVATRGPAAQAPDVAFSFFVAVVGSDQRVLARERFESSLVFEPTQRRAGVVEEIEEVIPLPEGLSGVNFEVLVGIVLTADQLDFNRRRQRR